MGTHTVTNQPPPLVDYNLYASDPVLGDAVSIQAGAWGTHQLTVFGERIGSAEVFEWGFAANQHEPVLHTHDRVGNRRDEVVFHPAYHALMDTSISHGLHALHREPNAPDGAHVVRTALFSLMAQVEAGHGCPISMTSSAIPAMETQPELASVWRPRLVSRRYDPSFAPAERKRGATFGMGMTEKQGGSDVRTNTTEAEPCNGGGPGGEYRVTGHKWFTSAPMCDGFLILAQAPGGLSCFLLPRFTPDGERNALHLLRLKDKVGNRSNASSEVEFHQASAWMVGEEGRGVRTIIEMVNGTRLDCVSGSVGLMRQAVAQAAWHVAHRAAFGGLLADKPLMRNVLADLEVEVEAATWLMIRLAGAFDRAGDDPEEAAFRRLATPVAKYWVTKRCTPVVREAMECLGGNGYVEDSILPRLYRESPVNAIWEGSGNVIALDALRAVTKEPAALEAFMAEIELARGADPVFDHALNVTPDVVRQPEPERAARRIIQHLAQVWAAALLHRFGDAAVAAAFTHSRLGGDHADLLGTLPEAADVAGISRRALPRV